MNELATIDASEQVDALVSLSNAAHDAYLDAAKNRSRMAAAIIKARATREILNAAMASKEIVADLLAMADPDVGMVEVVGNGITNDQKVRVMALALWNGFLPGEQEFAIFKSPSGASLYLKERGLMKMLLRLGAHSLHVTAEMPVQHKIQDGPTIWRVPGQAACTFNGEEYLLQFSGNGAIQLPCKMYRNDSGRETGTSDQIDGIMTKARRRMLQALYRTIAAEAGVQAEEDTDDDASGSGVLVRASKPALIESQPVEPAAQTSEQTLQTYLRGVAGEVADHVMELHALMQASTTLAQLDSVARQFREVMDEHRLSERVRQEMLRVYAARKGEVA